ncbi:MAG: GNAT family N-acetyltransferase [Cryobacterium sp.]|nr:GNAT family N-acetyltransferase [Cryobacterium sp.]
MSFNIRPLLAEDRGQWEPLFHAYREFHKLSFDSLVSDKVWGWLMDGNHPCFGLSAESDGILAGIAHYHVSPNSIVGGAILYLDDLYTSPIYRGRGVATQLIERLGDIARDQHAGDIRWVTNGWNSEARKFYRKISTETDWVTFTKTAGTAP